MLLIEEHRHYLDDEVRLTAFGAALAEVVRPGDVVLDLGCGTGILGFFACRAGAARVYAVDEGKIIALAAALAQANGMGGRVTFIEGHSTQIDLPERADVIVADQIGHFGFEAGLSQCVRDARARLAKPDARMVPSAVELWTAPVEAAAAYSCVDFWRSQPGGFDFGPARTIAVNTGYPVRFSTDDLLADPVRGHEMPADHSGTIDFDVHTVVSRIGTLHGLAGWFSARLSPGVCMTNAPTAARPVARSNLFLPLDRPLDVRPGDGIGIRMRIRPADVTAAWEVSVTRAGRDAAEDRFRHSTLGGMLLSATHLTKTRPAARPAVSRWGAARRTVLELCDGSATVAEIERELHRRHASLFRSHDDAAAFAAHVIARDAVVE